MRYHHVCAMQRPLGTEYAAGYVHSGWVKKDLGTATKRSANSGTSKNFWCIFCQLDSVCTAALRASSPETNSV